MRPKTAAVVMLLLLFLYVPGFAAGTHFSGLVRIPFQVSLDGTTVTGKDVSMTGYRLLVEYWDPHYRGGIGSGSVQLSVGSVLHLSKFNLTYLGAYVGDESYALIEVNTSYMIPGDTLTVAGYTIHLISVSSSGPAMVVTDPAGKKVSLSGKGKHRVGHLLITPGSFYPLVYSGYLRMNSTLSFDGHNITFVSVNVSQDFVSRAVFVVDGNETAVIKAGSETNVGPFSVAVDGVVCREANSSTCNCKCVHYAKVSIHYLGASLDVSVVPDFTFSLLPGQSRNIAKYYVLHYDYHFDGSARVHLSNLCGAEKASGRLSSLPAGSDLVYKGVVLFADSIDPESGKATFYGFLEGDKLPDISKIANLLVNYTFESGTQYAPVRGNVTIINTGTVAVSDVEVKVSYPSDVIPLNGDTFHVDSIKAGGKVVMPVVVVPVSSGNVSAGEVTVTGKVPYDPACCGYTLMTFTSNEGIIPVAPADVGYNITASISGVSCTFKVVNVTVENSGGMDLRPVMVIDHTPGMALYPGFNGTINGTLLLTRVEVPSGGSKAYTLRVMAERPVNGTLSVKLLNPYTSEVLASSSIPLKFGECREEVETVTNTVTSVVTQPCNCTSNITPITKTETLTKTSTKTLTKTTTTTSKVPYTPLGSKALWGGVGFALGFLSVVALAWYQARR